MLKGWSSRLPRIVRTFRFRLSALYLAIFGTLQVALAVAILFVREMDMRRELDERLFSRATLLSLSIAATETGANDPGLQRTLDRLLSSTSLSGYLVQICNGDGRVLAQNEAFGDDALAQLGPTVESGRRMRPVFTTLQPPVSGAGSAATAAHIRVLSLVQHTDDGKPLIVRVGRDMGLMEESISSLRRLIIWVGASGLAMAAGASWFVAKLSLRPIETVVRETAQISPRDLSSRLSIPGTHDEIDRVVRVFNSLLERIERGFDAHERFAADVAHELKTPLAVIQSEVQLLVRGDPSDPQWRQFAGSVEDEMRRMSRLVDALLMAARAQAGYPLPTRTLIDVTDIIVAAVDQCLGQAREQQVELVVRTDSLDVATHVQGDFDLLVTVVVNLIRNAIRASVPGQTVEISATADATHVMLAVRDRGPGIPESRRRRLFRRFEAGAPSCDGIGGEGLGLSIAGSILSLHRGEIDVKDREGGGADFVVTLPRNGPTANRVPDEEKLISD